MPSKSKTKGSAFERHIAKELSRITGESFIRAPGSGAYVGGVNSNRKEFLHEGQIRSFKGDVVPGESFSDWNIECKSYKEFPFHRLIHKDPIPILEDWIQQMLDVEDEGDKSLLFMKFNRIGVYALYDTDQWGYCGGDTGILYGDRWTFDTFDGWVERYMDRYLC